ncbi:MAG: CRISPR-associated helicase Cas3', partial [Desulfovibrionaceae bacterium]|nr:CRISPR-associated helicase Cas3' [Desulfovibrionaceae bacterium]
MLRPKHIAQKSTVTALPLQRCLAKTYKTPQGSVLPGRTVLDHACIVGEIAQALIALYPQTLHEEYFPAGSACIAGDHDVGKATPTFQKRIYAETDDMPPELEGIDPDLEKQWGGHAGAGQATLTACNPGKYLAEIVGRHHGRLVLRRHYRSTDEVLGGETWHTRRLELLDAVKAYFKEPWPQIASQAKADVLAGLTTVADWIGSGSLFDDPHAAWGDTIGRAVQGAGFITPDILPSLSFEHIFGNAPYPVQKEFYIACTGPGVYLLEAPMGLGKTEAALYAAYRLLSKKAATGLYFALPTRLTSDKIHERVQDFLQKILTPASPHRNALLLHGSAHLRDTELGEEGAPGGEWFNSLKRAILAPFGVGTLDQALLAVLPDIRHSFVRSFGLLGKVVILDEVHSYDVYTGLLIDSLIERLRQLHCTVIILSATLTRERRAVLLADSAERREYPLISARALEDSHVREMPAAPLPDCEVILHACDVEQNAFDEALLRSAQGQQALWIENTVAEAQASYKQLAARAPGNVEHGLLHSRFLPHDRARLEKHWTGCYGKDSSERGKQGRILVGTQVLEQSLDIDADFLVTRLCPVDMFLQRL